MNTSLPADAALQVFEFVRQRLEPHGWNVRQGFVGELLNIELRHALTSQLGIGIFNDERDQSVRIGRLLKMREFGVIEERPRDLPNESLVGRIRIAGQVGRWSPDVVTTIARVLRMESVITDAEADWLERAGPAWWESEE